VDVEGRIRAAIKSGNVGAYRKMVSKSDRTADQLLAIAVQDYNTAPKQAGHETIVDDLIARGAKARWPLLLEAARTGSRSLVERLFAHGAERNIFACALAGDFARLKRLLARDRTLTKATTSTESVHYQDFTPLHCCCLSALGRVDARTKAGLFQSGELLLQNGTDVNARGLFYSTLPVTPLDMAAHTGGNMELIELLICEGAVISSFAVGEAFSRRGRSLEEGFALAEVFLREGFKINSEFKDGTLLHSAANGGSAEVVRWLLERGADVRARNRMGRTALHVAAERNRSARVVEVLAEAGADLKARDDGGMTPLEVAVGHRKWVVAEWLRLRGG
jgi:hypothetical protein